MKASAKANSNIAFVKYWGKRDTKLIIPTNPSISMTMEGLTTHTTIEFSSEYTENEVVLNGKGQSGKSLEKISTQVERIKKLANCALNYKLVSKNNFPTAAGMASSASGFAALSTAAAAALGLELDRKELSILSRRGSGSACRSVHGGYVEWLMGDSNDTSYANQIADENHLDIRNIIAVVAAGEKKISSRVGMQTTIDTCPLYKARLEAVKQTYKDVREGILEKDFTKIGKAAELDMLIMHATMMTTVPSLLYWAPATVAVLHAVYDMREEGLEAYSTIDAGPNVHVLTLPKNEKEVTKRLESIAGVESLIHTKPGKGAELVSEGLF